MTPAVRELPEGETTRAWPALHELRAHLRDEAELVSRVDGVQRAEGYRLAATFEGDDVAGVAGSRTGHSLSRGHFLYVDDLVTVPEHRGRGHAGALLRWLFDEADRLGCEQVRLDSGTHRHPADHAPSTAWPARSRSRDAGESWPNSRRAWNTSSYSPPGARGSGVVASSNGVAGAVATTVKPVGVPPVPAATGTPSTSASSHPSRSSPTTRAAAPRRSPRSRPVPSSSQWSGRWIS